MSLAISRASSQEAPAAPPPGHVRTDGAALSIFITPAVQLILRLVERSTGLATDEIVARGICAYANEVGVPSLAADLDGRCGMGPRVKPGDDGSGMSGGP